MRKLLLILLLAATPSFAGITYTAETRTILGAKDSNGDFRVQGWVSGNRARMEFLYSALPQLETGTYLVSSDGGNTVYFVNPKDKTFELWDISGMISNMADMMRSMRGGMRVRFEEPKVEKLLEEEGPRILNLPTRHYRFRTSYHASIDMYDTETINTVTEEDIWTTNAISEPGVKIFLDRRMSSGDEQLDRILDKEMSKVIGFPLRRLTSTRQETKKQVTETRSEMNIVELKTVDVADSIFEVPKGYTQEDPNESGLERGLKKLEREQKEQQKQQQ
jgi:hypothetical protein